MFRFFTGFPGREVLVSYRSYLVLDLSLRESAIHFNEEYGKIVDFPLVLPGGCLIELLITSEDVIHSWTVNGLGVKCDAVPGRLNSAYLKGLRPGYSC
jgi:heme/copper-type cytochrome/quinol oxidase subunit 2